MITDIFGQRYLNDMKFDRNGAENIIGPLLVQAYYVFFEDLQQQFHFDDRFFREVALTTLQEARFGQRMTEQAICTAYLTKPFKPDREWFGTPDYYCKTRLSMMELLFRAAEERVRRLTAELSGNISVPIPGWQNIVSKAVAELNERLRMWRTGLVYHNGLLHRAGDEQSDQRIAKPFWEIVADPKWAVVDGEMKEAVDRLDHGQEDAFTHACDALESTMKITSGDKGWTTGTEKGAVAYITNLRTGGFLEKWEVEPLTFIFTKLRNPHRHGGGSNPQTLSQMPSRTGPSRAACRGSRASCGGLLSLASEFRSRRSGPNFGPNGRGTGQICRAHIGTSPSEYRWKIGRISTSRHQLDQRLSRA
jgi:hypothetical protein